MSLFAWFQRFAGFPSRARKVVNNPGQSHPGGDYQDDDAVKWFRKSAAKGGAWGQFSLGLRYLKGSGVQPDPVEAMRWFLCAATQGHAMAQYHVGRMFEQGLGAATDPVEAYKWFHLAALQGVREAQAALDRLRRGLNAEQIAEGQRKAAGFVPQKINPPQIKGDSR